MVLMKWAQKHVPRIRMLKEHLTDEVIVEAVCNIMMIVHVGLGLAVLVGGEGRFSPPSYTPLIEMTNGHVWIWGAWTLLAAGGMMTPYKWGQVAGLWLGMFWMAMWAALFGVATFTYPEANATAMIAYGGFAAIDTALLTAKVLEHGRR
jgi:hypothetical protein